MDLWGLALMAINHEMFFGKVSPTVTEMLNECGAKEIVTAIRDWK